MGKRNPYIYPFPYPFWLRTVYRRHIHSCLFFFFFILGPNDGDFIGRGSWNKKKKQEAKSNERKTGNLHLGCKAHFAKCRQRLFILYTLHISTAPKEQIPCLSSCWLFVSISSHLYYFFFFLPLCGISCAHRQTHLSYCMAAMSPYCSFHIWFRFVLCYYYDTQRDVAATANDDAEYNVLRSRQF